jgi:hypothetical protein
MDPKAGKSPRLFNPFAIWTNFALKSGEAMLDAAQAAIARPKAPRVAVLPTEDRPARKAGPQRLSKSARKARKNASSRARRRGR